MGFIFKFRILLAVISKLIDEILAKGMKRIIYKFICLDKKMNIIDNDSDYQAINNLLRAFI